MTAADRPDNGQDERPAPTVANWSETCDWGHCNGQSYGVRWADDLGMWLPVCRKHRARDVVLFDELSLLADAEPCRVYSHGTDGWHCALTGPHEQHTNAARTETW